MTDQSQRRSKGRRGSSCPFIGPAFLEPATTPDIYALIGFAVYWAIALSLVAITRFGERRSLASLGFKGLPWRMVAVAVGLGILLSATVPVLTLLVSQVLPSAESEGVMDTAAGYPPAVILLSVLTAGVTEEVLFRGYAIDDDDPR
jgi:membrane protease YdiL (CAAX protease family)